MAMDPAQRRYFGRMIPITILYGLAVFFASWIVPDGAAATLDDCSSIGARACGLGLHLGDGPLSGRTFGRICAVARSAKALVATGLTLALASGWGILELFTNVPRVPLFLRLSGLVPRARGRLARQPDDSGHRESRRMRNRLKVLRAERDWNQGDLAERLQVSRRSVNAIETGKYDPSLPLAFRIADLFRPADRGRFS